MKLTELYVTAIDYDSTRVRKDLGDIEGLAESIGSFGILHPIVVDYEGRLIAGYRRLMAVKSLKWDKVTCAVVDNFNDAVSYLKAERDENTCRKDFAPSELVEIGLRIESLIKPEIGRRSIATQIKNGKPPTALVDLPTPQNKGKTRDLVAETIGVSGSTYERAKKVTQAAKDDPEKFGDLPAKMDAESVDAAHKELKRRKAEPEDDEPRDQVGMIIPAGLRAAFAEVAPMFAEATSLAKRLGVVMEQIANTSGGVWLRGEMQCLDGGRFKCEDLKACQSKLKNTAPYCSACPYCTAAGKVKKDCNGCHGLDWGPRSLWDRAPDEEKALTVKANGGKS